MKKSTLILLLINILDNISEYCEYGACEAAKANLEYIIKKIKEEEIENDD